MRLGIHRGPGFSDRWIEWCEAQGVAWKPVDCYRSDIVAQLADCDGLMWHWHQTNPKDVLFARQLTAALEAGGKAVFPDVATSWHFDYKVAQKYLFEAIGAPSPPTQVFYDLASALRWIGEAEFPQVFKLRRGAGSVNVQLVRTRGEARRLAQQAFGRGFAVVNRLAEIRDNARKARRTGDLQPLLKAARSAARLVRPNTFERQDGRERGYLYLQAFAPDNDHDTRVVVVGDRAWALRRRVRPNDFRASGSGDALYDPDGIDRRMLRIALDVRAKLGAQCLSFDFVRGADGAPLIVEISYGFPIGAFLDNCPGHWDGALTFHADQENRPQHFMAADLVARIRAQRA
ncbi:MAG: hypothetical protein KC613_23220 [Myxococcales bacterium]|nr:hypothetical protein [Myxococcales bacterium]